MQVGMEANREVSVKRQADSQEERGLRARIDELIVELGGITLAAPGDIASVVTEVFGRGRIASRAGEFGLTEGMAYDLSTGWDLNVKEQRLLVEQQIAAQRPLFLIGSPRCTAWSNLLNFGTIKEVTMQSLMKEALEHINTCVRLYALQHAHG